jgi:hypothetical protein
MNEAWLITGCSRSLKKARAVATLPLGAADLAINGHHVPYIRDISPAPPTPSAGPD